MIRPWNYLAVRGTAAAVQAAHAFAKRKNELLAMQGEMAAGGRQGVSANCSMRT